MVSKVRRRDNPQLNLNQYHHRNMGKRSKLPGLPKNKGFGDYELDGIVYLCPWEYLFRPVLIDGKLSKRYFVDRHGNVYNKETGRRMVPLKHRGVDNDYCRMQLSYAPYKFKSMSVHRMVATAFIPNPDNLPEVNHKDGVKYHNWVENLEWSSKSDNLKHAFMNGLATNRGDANPNRKLSADDVFKILEILDKPGRPSMKKVGKLFGVSKPTISHIYKGDTWHDVYVKYHNTVR